jgi:hypothetical protein
MCRMILSEAIAFFLDHEIDEVGCSWHQTMPSKNAHVVLECMHTKSRVHSRNTRVFLLSINDNLVNSQEHVHALNATNITFNIHQTFL